jgi:hypothetical protein
MAIIKGTQEIAGNDVYIKTTKNGEMVTSDITRIWTAKGYGRQAMATAAVAAVVVRPSTTAIASLYNFGSSYFVIERAFAHELVSAAVTTANIWLCVHPTGTIVSGFADDIAPRRGTSGNVPANDGSYFDIEDTVLDAGWFPWSENYGYALTVTTPSVVLMANVNGRIIVPPTAGISMSVVASVNTATFTCGFHWYTVPASEMDIV